MCEKFDNSNSIAWKEIRTFIWISELAALRRRRFALNVFYSRYVPPHRRLVWQSWKLCCLWIRRSDVMAALYHASAVYRARSSGNLPMSPIFVRLKVVSISFWRVHAVNFPWINLLGTGKQSVLWKIRQSPSSHNEVKRCPHYEITSCWKNPFANFVRTVRQSELPRN